MEILTNTNRERLVSIVENYVVELLEDKENSNIEDLASAFSNAGFTKSEFFQILDKYYLNDYTWAEETAPAPTTEEVSVGDSDQAILETALTQIGIPYTYEKIDSIGNSKIKIKTVDGRRNINETSTIIYFTKDGEFDGIY